MSYRVMVIDPGVGGTGIATWEHDKWKDSECHNPLYAHCSYGDSPSWLSKAASIATHVRNIVANEDIVSIHCEFPQFFDSSGGHMVAARGDLQKLTFIVGVFSEIAWSHRIPFYPHEVGEWKGQMSKKAVIQSIKRRLPLIDDINPESHAWDAIGIGLHAQGKFLKEKKSKHVY